MFHTCRWIATSLRRRLASARSPDQPTRRKPTTRFVLEPLEDRTVPAAVTVTNLSDVVNAPDMSSLTTLMANSGGDGISLREAITAANNTAAADDITFQAGLNGTLTLTG